MTDTTDIATLRRQMLETCRRMNSSGINQGTAGNLSVRLAKGFLITPSGLPYDTMTPQDIVEMDFDGTYVGRRPSSEWRFHRDILKARDDVDVVLHCHSIYATTLACHHKSIPSFHYMTGVAGGTDIRCAQYATFGTQALSDNALVALKDRKALEGHQDGNDALMATETLKRAYRTDVEPILAEARRRAGGAIDPVAADRASGYRRKVAAERPASAAGGGGII
jgi:L-fuculose-phosphate aldolase